MRVEALFVVLMLVFSACSDESEEEGTDAASDVVSDTAADTPSETTSGCPDPAGYCSSIDALSMTGFSAACDGNVVSTDALGGGPTQGISCTNPEDPTWNIWDSEGFVQEDIGGHVCVATVVDDHNTSIRIPEDDFICKRGYSPVWTDSSNRCHREVRENHFVHSPNCPTGWVQCQMSDEVTEGACQE
ncbi:MAG: hypothetical protein JW797_03530 [Bradymonadales bacterium]|nr:hypothetical protein [Bradymonadales bacterium]